MNTPKPCDTCTHLYYDAMQKLNPNYMAECKEELEMGKKDCLKHTEWRSKDGS